MKTNTKDKGTLYECQNSHRGNCSPDEAAYFGDDFDDIEPIKKCGLGKAMTPMELRNSSERNYYVDSKNTKGGK